jgi:hypothetical protein
LYRYRLHVINVEYCQHFLKLYYYTDYSLTTAIQYISLTLNKPKRICSLSLVELFSVQNVKHYHNIKVDGNFNYKNSWSVLVVLALKNDWQIEIKMLTNYFELKSARNKLPQCCLCQTSSTRSNLLSSHQNGMCTLQCNNLHYEIYQYPHSAMRS